jgi:ubiquinone/menaquinone biosynthesis C-methylase UbiE
MMTKMKKTIQKEINKDELRAAFLEFTEKAFACIPKRKNPRILDIGCGTGIPTIELAKLSGGEVVGLDIDKASIERFQQRIEEEGLSERVRALQCSLFVMDFPDHSFDMVWAEGVIAVIGFKEGLQRWRKLLKPKGYLVVHDDDEKVEEKERAISSCGYVLIEKIPIPSSIWWERYFLPLKERIDRLLLSYRDDPEVVHHLEKERDEWEQYGRTPHGSMFFIMRKPERSKLWKKWKSF